MCKCFCLWYISDCPFYLLSALSHLIKRLDRRIAKQDKIGQFKFKKRVLADPSQLEPPLGYPAWAVQSSPALSETERTCSSLDTSTCTLHTSDHDAEC